jgi:predicted HicB family RNase H-like nuclease
LKPRASGFKTKWYIQAHCIKDYCPMPELKTAVLMIRIEPSLKRKAERRAAAEDRSVASYIERLIEQDAKRS